MIHQFKHNGTYIVLDIPSGAVHALDPLTYDICGILQAPLDKVCPEDIIKEILLLDKDYHSEDIIDAYSELYDLYTEGLLFSEDEVYPISVVKPEHSPIKALCLHVSHDCNLRCRYCFAQTGNFGTNRSLMTPEVAKKAIDFVIDQSGSRRNIEIDFFGGEPLMAWDTVKQTVEYANKIADEHGKNFRFTITTNGVLLDKEKTAYINEHMSNVVLSLDGRKEVNDSMRKTISGGGSYDIVMPKFRDLVKSRSLDKDYYIRGTFTAENLNFTTDVLDFYGNGFDQISIEPVTAPDGCGYEIKTSDLPRIQEEYWKLAETMLSMEDADDAFNFFHFNVDLEQGPCVIKRLRGCGAGCEYVAITPEGDVYPCHQFVGMENFNMGNILDGSFDKSVADPFASVSVYTRPKCKECWARFYCSGGCSAANLNANGDIDDCYEIGCELERMRLECAIYLSVYRALNTLDTQDN